MEIKPTKPEGSGSLSSNPWAAGEVPPGPPLPMSNVWVQMMIKMFPQASPEQLSRYAQQLQNNMMRMMNAAIARMSKIMREANQRMKRVIQGQE